MTDCYIASQYKALCGGNSVLTFYVDGKAVFNFIGYMNIHRGDMPSINECLHMIGVKMDRRFSNAKLIEEQAVQHFAMQQRVAREMNPMHLDAQKRTYVLELQGHASHFAHMARTWVDSAARMDAQGDIYIAHDDRMAAVAQQQEAAKRFICIAGVRGLFDTPCMDDAHAVEAESSRVAGNPLPASVPTILRPVEARAMHAAMSALALNLNASFEFDVSFMPLSWARGYIQVQWGDNVTVTHRENMSTKAHESYPDLPAFARAYGIV